MPSFYAASRDVLFRFGRDLWVLPKEEPVAELPTIAIAPPVATRRCRDNDASGAARRAREMMERNHLI
ncbi:hypothetical protein MAUB1S_08277 [Mycolicibacterium aubagnense]